MKQTAGIFRRLGCRDQFALERCSNTSLVASEYMVLLELDELAHRDIADGHFRRILEELDSPAVKVRAKHLDIGDIHRIFRQSQHHCVSRLDRMLDSDSAGIRSDNNPESVRLADKHRLPP